jgi:hypothetical protein
MSEQNSDRSSDVRSVTKRQLGIFVAIVGAVGSVAIVAVDRLGAGEWSGFGPLQQIALGLGIALLIIGLLLVRVGDRPA